MNKNMKLSRNYSISALFFLTFLFNQSVLSQPINSDNVYIKTNGTQFTVNNKPYYYVGANFWAGMNLGALSKSGNRDRLVRELDRMHHIGINNLRILALSEGPDTEPYRIIPSNNDKGILKEEYLVGLDFLLSEMKKRGMYAVVCLSNFWPWSGGFAQYQKWAGDIDTIHYPMDTTKTQDWDLYMQETSRFYSSPKAKELYNQSIKKIILRVNTLSNLEYRNDATIMSWELCNEPRGMKNLKDYLLWIDNAANYIKQLDSNHLVTVGSEGLDSYKETNGTPFIETHISKSIDYTCAHLWVQNWNWYDIKKHQQTYPNALKKVAEYLEEHINLAMKLNKPFVLEEFGIGRDEGSCDPTVTTKIRDDYYSYVFSLIYSYAKQHKASGVNFWAWGGEGRPRNGGCWWKEGDDFIGDPPHEPQGWYSVYNKDQSTLKVVKKYTRRMNRIKR
jgi:mannan endo-1,4-beta-mannosidase